MRTGIYPAALHVCGGGEKYIGKIAEILSMDNDVAFIVPTEPDFQQLESRLNIDLSRVAVDNIGSPVLALGTRIAAVNALLGLLRAKPISKVTKKYDMFINQEHGTFIRSFARRSVLICEVPPVERSLPNNQFTRLLFDPEIKTYDTIVVNSRYTKKWAEKRYGREATVLYPPVDTESFIPLSKGDIILSVGRFSTSLHSKKQLEMIRAFKKLRAGRGLAGWEYHLVGGVGDNPRDRAYLQACEREAKDYPVFFHANAPFEIMKGLYGRAKIFWHATGLGEDEDEHPERMEHFGMTTVEAMSAGCVPVVIRKGGQPEIVQDGRSGFLFETVEELNQITSRLIADNALWTKVSEACIVRSQEFSLEKFERGVKHIFSA